MAYGIQPLHFLITNHRRTIQTVENIVMSRTTHDLLHILYFVTPALSIIQVIKEMLNKTKRLHLLIPNVNVR